MLENASDTKSLLGIFLHFMVVNSLKLMQMTVDMFLPVYIRFSSPVQLHP